MAINNILTHITSNIIKNIVPTRCGVCNGYSKSIICDSCYTGFVRNSRCCNICAQPFAHVDSLAQKNQPICGQCLSCKPHYNRVISPYIHTGGMRSLVHKLKLSSNLVLAKFFANEIAASITLQKIPNIRSSIVVPVPIHNKRHKSRGYSQTHLIAKALAAKLNMPYDYWSLTQIKSTAPQSGLSKQARKQNVQHVYKFEPNPAYCSQNIIIIDDVITTGSTINSIAKSVRKIYPSHELIFCSITRTSNADSSAFIKR